LPPLLVVRYRAVLGQQERPRHGPGAAVVETDRARVSQDSLTGRVAPHRRRRRGGSVPNFAEQSALASDSDSAPAPDPDTAGGGDVGNVFVAQHATVQPPAAERLALALVRVAFEFCHDGRDAAAAAAAGIVQPAGPLRNHAGEYPTSAIVPALLDADDAASATAAATTTTRAARCVPVRGHRRHGLFRTAAVARTGAVCADHERRVKEGGRSVGPYDRLWKY
jgi:hypothetical protein